MVQLKPGQKQFNLVFEGKDLQIIDDVGKSIGSKTKTGALYNIFKKYKDYIYNLEGQDKVDDFMIEDPDDSKDCPHCGETLI